MEFKPRNHLSTIVKTVACAGLGCLIVILMLPVIAGTFWLPVLAGALAVSTLAVATRFFERVEMSVLMALSVVIGAILIGAIFSTLFIAFVPLVWANIWFLFVAITFLGLGVGVISYRLARREIEKDEPPVSEEDGVSPETSPDEETPPATGPAKE